MEDEHSEGGHPEEKQQLSRFRDTTIAFDNLIVQVGQGLARAQQTMDLSQIEFQRQVAKALAEGRMRQLDVNPANAYSIPETKLELKVGMSMQYPKGGGQPTVTAVPLNATTANQHDVDVEASTEVKLRFVSVPQAKDIPGTEASRLSREEAQQLAENDSRVTALGVELNKPQAQLAFIEQSRIWLLVYLQAREPSLIVVIDDRRRKIISIVYEPLLPPAYKLEPVGIPKLDRIEPSAGRQGDILSIYGDNFLTLGGQTVLLLDGQPIPLIHSSMDTIRFKIPSWAVRGDVEVVTPLGSTEQSGVAAFTPIPSILSFSPKRGYYDALRQRGSWISVSGNNLREGVNLRFANGVLSRRHKILSSGQMQVEVPADAESGPLTLVFDQHQQTISDMFIMLPRIERVSPRQARVGDEVRLSGNTLEGVSELVIGSAPIARAEFLLHTNDQIRFLLPPRAFDGRIRARQQLDSDVYADAQSRDIFYVVPKITGFGHSAAGVGQLLTVFGEGLDPQADMMTLLFDARGGISEAPVLSVSNDRKSLSTRVPMDAVSGYVTLLRKRIYSDFSPADTSSMSLNKLSVLTLNGALADVVLEERFESDLSCFNSQAGSWHIDRGMLASEGTSSLSFELPMARERLALYADVLSAECFGFSFTPAGGSTQLQLWINLLATQPALTWSTLNTRKQQKILDGTPLNLLPDSNHLAQVIFTEGRLSLLLNQVEVASYDWGVKEIAKVALLADSSQQRWDNVVLLKDDYLSLPAPDFYRFGAIPTTHTLPEVRIDSISPTQGHEGTEVLIKGKGLDEAAQFFFGAKAATVLEALDTQARIEVPQGARSGTIEVHGRGGVIVSSGDKRFTLPPTIKGLSPNPVLVGQVLHILGSNLPPEQGEFDVTVLGKAAQVVNSSPSMISLLVPDIVGTGALELSYMGFTAEAPTTLEIRKETLVLDLIESAQQAQWSTAAGLVNLGQLGNTGEASVQLREREHLEDDRHYGQVLYLHPPKPSYRALRGEFPQQPLPQGRLVLQMDFGMLWTAAPASEEITEVDGVIYEVNFEASDSGEVVELLPRTTCVHDGSLERFTIDASVLSGKTGALVVSVYPGRNGLRDDTAMVKGSLLQLS